MNGSTDGAKCDTIKILEDNNMLFRKKLVIVHLVEVLLATLFLFYGHSSIAFAENSQKTPILNSSAVAVPDRWSAQAAQEIFKKGGNAVDVAVAVAFTLAVTYPEAGNIGGGGFMTLYVKGKPYFLDYRERAPILATKNMYLDDKGELIKDMSLYGDRAVGVPGTVNGMWKVHKRFGKLKWEEVLNPAIHYAEHGFLVSKEIANKASHAEKIFQSKTNFHHYFANLKPGVLFKQPDLAKVLKRIAKVGAADFYNGITADLIVTTMKQGNGLISKQDLQSYQARWRDPLIVNWNGYQIITASPPSSGGIGLVQLLKMKSYLKKEFKHVPLNSAHYIHLVSEMEKRVFADRAEYLGDPDFYKVPVQQLINDNYLLKRAHEINLTKPTATKEIKPGLRLTSQEKTQTTHFSIIDKWGNAVSNTYTLNGDFGSGVVVIGGGFLLNNEMDDFSVKPGVANMFGVVGSHANAIAPVKRPLSSMSPTILVKNGKVALIIGTPGGSRIFTSVFQVITDIYDYHLPLSAAVAQMRFHHQLLPHNTIFMEPYQPITGKLANELKAMGYVLKTQDFNGDIQVIKTNGKNVEPVADPRGQGVARTFH